MYPIGLNPRLSPTPCVAAVTAKAPPQNGRRQRYSRRVASSQSSSSESYQLEGAATGRGGVGVAVTAGGTAVQCLASLCSSTQRPLSWRATAPHVGHTGASGVGYLPTRRANMARPVVSSLCVSSLTTLVQAAARWKNLPRHRREAGSRRLPNARGDVRQRQPAALRCRAASRLLD